MLACFIHFKTSDVFGIVLLRKHPTMSKLEPSSCWSDVKLRDLEVVFLLNYSIHVVLYTSTTGRKWATACLTVSLRFEFSFSLTLVFVTKQLNLCVVWPQKFSREGIWLVHVGSCTFQLSLKVLILEQRLLCWSVPCNPGFTVDSCVGVTVVSSSWQVWASMFPGLFLNILTIVLLSESDSSSSRPKWWHVWIICTCVLNLEFAAV